jgi:hypothetical protein
LVRFITHQDSFEHIRDNWKSCNEVSELNGKRDLILTDSEIVSAKGSSLVFKIVREAVLKLQNSMCCMYLPILYGCHQSLAALKDSSSSLFLERTGQEYLRVGVMASIVSRVSSTQLSDDSRKLYVKAMLMEPYLKGKIDQKTTNAPSKIFPDWIKMRYLEDLKKDLVKELEVIIRESRESIIESSSSSESESTDDEERRRRKKKKKNAPTDLLGFLDDSVEDSSDDCDTLKSEEFPWFKKSYLDSNLSCESQESSELYWKDRRKTQPNVIKLLCRYRSVACTSIFEESCFSSIDKIFTRDRESLKDSSVEAMMFCKKNWTCFMNK